MRKNFLLITFILLAAVQVCAQSVNITKSAGWLESAHVEWLPVENAISYNVYYSGEGIMDQKIDDQLIRYYGTYHRADVLGLSAGTYTIKVAPVFAGEGDSENYEGTGKVSDNITVKAHDRTGFAFANGRVPGAYKANGTPKDGALILYVTEKTKNTISLDVTGANSNPCVGIQNILEGFKKGKDARPLIVRLVGQVTDPSYLDKGDIIIENKNNASSYITLEGVGDDATADGWGIRIKNASNVEVRNIGTMNCDSDEGDNIGLQQDNDYIWIHNCDFFYGHAGSDSDQAKGDGALDCKKSNYVTFSYNHFWDTGKSNLLGLSGETDQHYITYHHNWYDHSDSRHPRVRFYSAHVYNNYYDGIAKYGVGSTLGSSVFVEANYFRNCKYPILTSMQGSDVWDEKKQANDYSNMPTFSKEDGGTIKVFNNYMDGNEKRFIPYGSASTGSYDTTVDFDGYVVSSRNEQVPSTVKSSRGANTYNNFDTNSSIMYTYTPDSPEDAKTNVMTYAGRIEGGDFKWTFNNSVDDSSYDVNAELKAALMAYTTTLDSIQGDGKGSSGGGGGGIVIPPSDACAKEYIFQTQTNTDNTFTLGGKNNSKVLTEVVTYNGMSLTSTLKVEGTTTITFTTTTDNAKLTIGVAAAKSGSALKLNGESIFTGIGTTFEEKEVTLGEAGTTYTIAKGTNENYIYYVVVKENCNTTGMENVTEEESEFRLYPNPVMDDLYIVSETDVEAIEIYSISGAMIQRIKGNVETVNMSNLNAGSYIINVHTAKGSHRQIILKR